MSYVLFYTHENGRPHRIRTYSSEAAGRRGLRASNRNAGFVQRISRAWNSGVELEWCLRDDGSYDYGPYAIMQSADFEVASNQLVKVKSLMTGAEVSISEQDVGGPCDPSTERYWST